MAEIWALAVKDLKILLRDKAGIFFTFFFPVLFAVFFGTIFGGFGGGGGGSATQIVVVDLDQSDTSRALIESLDAEDQLAVTAMETQEAATDAVRKGDKTAFVVIPQGFGDIGFEIFQGEPMRLTVGVDPSRQAEGGLIKGMITGKAFQLLQETFLDPQSASGFTQDAIDSIDGMDGLSGAQKLLLRTALTGMTSFLEQLPDDDAADDDGEAADGGGAVGFNPLEIEDAEIVAEDDGDDISPYAISFPQGMIWGVMGCASAFGISLVTERNGGTLTRLRTSPIGRQRLLLGKGLACFITTVGVATLLLLIARIAFGVSPASLPLLVLSIVCVASAFVGIMMLLSTIGKTEAAAGGIGWAVMLVFAMFGGGMIPLFAMQGWMVTLSNFSPIKWAIYAIEGPVWRDLAFTELLPAYGILLGVGFAGFALGSRLFDWTEPS